MSELREAINEMRNMRESYNEIAGVVGGITGIEPDITAGKAAIAEAITDKGVQTSATDTLAKMADNVSAIAQSPITIDGGEMYAKQLYGSLTIPNYWNLYEVMEQLLSDGRLLNYGGILLAEYYKGYDSLALAGAGAGGAYVVSDKDANGQFIMYTADTTHTWNTEDDGKGNRWVAYCFADSGHGFTITNTDTSPHSIHIGRNVGKIECLVNTRISDIIVDDGNYLEEFDGGNKTHNFGRVLVLRNIGKVTNLGVSSNTEIVYTEADNCDSMYPNRTNKNTIIFVPKSGSFLYGNSVYGSQTSSTSVFIIKAETIQPSTTGSFPIFVGDVKRIVFLGLETLNPNNHGVTTYSRTESVYFGYKTNDKTKTVNYLLLIDLPTITKAEVQEGWCKHLNIKGMIGLTKQNVQNYIFDRLGVNDISTGSVTITLAASVLALFTQEEIDAVVERTNITIVGA